MKHPVVLYQCEDCGREYQVVDGVEVVNKFAWVKWDERGARKCKACCSDVLDTLLEDTPVYVNKIGEIVDIGARA